MAGPIDQHGRRSWSAGNDSLDPQKSWNQSVDLEQMRNEILGGLIDAMYYGKKLILRQKRKGRRMQTYRPMDPDEVNYESALDQLRNKERTNIQWAPYPS